MGLEKNPCVNSGSTLPLIALPAAHERRMEVAHSHTFHVTPPLWSQQEVMSQAASSLGPVPSERRFSTARSSSVREIVTPSNNGPTWLA